MTKKEALIVTLSTNRPSASTRSTGANDKDRTIFHQLTSASNSRPFPDAAGTLEGVGGSSCGPDHPNPTTTTIRPW